MSFVAITVAALLGAAADFIGERLAVTNFKGSQVLGTVAAVAGALFIFKGVALIVVLWLMRAAFGGPIVWNGNGFGVLLAVVGVGLCTFAASVFKEPPPPSGGEA